MSSFVKGLVITGCAALSICVYAQPPQNTASQNSAGAVADVVHVAGLTEVKSDVRGTLAVTPAEVVFSNDKLRATIARDRIVNVFVGDQRTEPWGTTGKIVRKVIPYGGGSALGAVSSGQSDLLTIESLDEHGGYHGVVFTVSFRKGAAIREQLIANIVPPTVIPPQPCSEGQERPRSVLLAPIMVSGAELPDEYRILLYEQLLKQLRTRDPDDSFLRTGDLATGSGCTELTLRVNVLGFKKGNRAVRASTGPLGLFLGTTSLSFEVHLQDIKGNTVFEAQMKKNDRTDSDSLSLADEIAKSVSKRIEKEMRKRSPRTGRAS